MRVYPRGLALPVQRACPSFNAADTGDVPACMRVALSEAGTRQRRGCTRSTGGDLCAWAPESVCRQWHMDTAVQRLHSPGGSAAAAPGSPGRGPEGAGSSGGR